MTDTITTAIIAAGAAILGALVGGGFGVWNATITKRSEERRHTNEMLLNSAMEYWKLSVEMAKRAADSGLRGVTALPFDLYLIHMLNLWAVLERQDTTARNIASRLKDVNDLVSAAEQEIDRHSDALRLKDHESGKQQQR